MSSFFMNPFVYWLCALVAMPYMATEVKQDFNSHFEDGLSVTGFDIAYYCLLIGSCFVPLVNAIVAFSSITYFKVWEKV